MLKSNIFIIGLVLAGGSARAGQGPQEGAARQPHAGTAPIQIEILFRAPFLCNRSVVGPLCPHNHSQGGQGRPPHYFGGLNDYVSFNFLLSLKGPSA